MNQHASNAPVLALDFDGVIADAFDECVAVTYHAVSGADKQIPDLLEAIKVIPGSFRDRFRSVRPHCRTLDDFMVTHFVDTATATRKDFEDAKARIPSETLNQFAERGEQLRTTWRTGDESTWLSSHTLWAQVLRSMEQWPGSIWIISAKDEQSIRQILTFHDALDAVDVIAGSCGSKLSALTAAAKQGATTFIDDNLQNVIEANALEGVNAKWATWGYSSAEDARLALSLKTQRVQLDTILPMLNDVTLASTTN